MKFFSVPNWVASTVTVLDRPWEIKPSVSPPYAGGKKAMAEFAQSVLTNHHYLSAYEGMTEKVRIAETTGNSLFRIHGFIADYDAPLPPDPVAYLLKNASCAFLPTWVVRTASDQGRLVWALELPLMMADGEARELLRVVYRELRLNTWLRGFDDTAWSNTAQYYELGKEWLPVRPDAVIPAANVDMWLLQATKEVRYDTQSKFEYTIPMEDIAAAVKERFPGRWKGEFTDGKRGVRFWDPSADNPTGALVRPDGMRCFTGNQPFVNWRQILGHEFVDKYESDFVGKAIKDTAWDGRCFWMRNDENIWQAWPSDRFRQDLVVKGFSKKPRKGEASAVDLIENTIAHKKQVVAALPFIYFPDGIITHEGRKFLNISDISCLQPAPPFASCESFAAGRTGYPFVYELLKTLLGSEPDNDLQLYAFLAWLKHFYVHSLRRKPRAGHAIVLAGLVGQGKTLLVRKIIGDLMTGHSGNTGARVKDASDHLVNGSRWTEAIAKSPIMRIDDSLASSDPKGHKQFTERIKRIVSTNEMFSEQKFQKGGTVPWYGRIVITCNTDAESLSILPSMDMSTADKICLFRTSERRMVLPEYEEIDRLCVAELPNFARFLLDWKIPDGLRAAEHRFGVVTYHHPDLLDEAHSQGVGELLDVLVPFLEAYHQGKPDTRYWKGSATQLYSDLCTFNAVGMRSMTAKSTATKLGIMLKNGMNMSRHTTGVQRLWKIGYDLTKGDVRCVETSAQDAQ